MKRCLPFLSLMKNCPENFGRQWGSRHELVQRVYHRLAFFLLVSGARGGGEGRGACVIQLPLGRDHEISFLNSRCEGIRVPQELLVYSFLRFLSFFT